MNKQKGNVLIIILFVLVIAGTAVMAFRLSKSQNTIIKQNTNSPITPTGEMTTTNKRILFTPVNKRTINVNEMCDVYSNHDEPYKYIKYSNIEKGLSFDVPYNENWGTEKYYINPFDELGKEIQAGNDIDMGPYVQGEGCFRAIYLRYLPHREISNAIETAKKDNGNGLPECIVKPIQEIAKNVSYIRFEGVCGLGYSADYEVIGEKYNYQLSTSNADYDKHIKGIINSIQLIK